MHAINFGFLVLATWTALGILDCLRGPRSPTRGFDVALWAYLLWLALSPGIISWNTITLMDTSLWSALILLGVYLLCRLALDRRPQSYSRNMALLTCVMVPTRPESLGIVPVFMALAIGIAYWNERSWTAVRQAITGPFFAFVTTVGALSLFRYTYFGYLLPNTYYAKVSPHLAYNIEEGLRYVYWVTQISPLFLPLLGIAAILLLRSVIELAQENKGTGPHLSLIAITVSILALLGSTIATGGDHFTQGRFLIQALMLAPLPALALVSSEVRFPAGRLVTPVALACLAGCLVIDWREIHAVENLQGLLFEFNINRDGMETGVLLDRSIPVKPKPSLGVIMAGGISRTYGGEIVDVMGLNNTLVAHTKGDRYGKKNHAAFSPQAFYQLQPDLFAATLLKRLGEGCDYNFVDYVTQGIRKEQKFQDTYEEVELWLPETQTNMQGTLLDNAPGLARWFSPNILPGQYGVRIFMKRSVAESLRSRGVAVRQACLPAD